MANEVKFNIKLNIDGKDRVVVATTAVDNLKHVVNSVNEATEDLKSKLINTNQIMEAWKNVTDAFQQMVGVLDQVTAESRTFGAAMAAANTMAGKSGKEFASMKQQVAELAKEIPIARDELAGGLYQVISNGVPEDNWIDYLRSSAEASVGGIADLGEVVKVTSTIIKNYGLEWSNAGEIQDKIQLTAKNGVTSFEQMAQALPRVTAQASTLGVSIDELMASFATLTGVSGNTAEVSTQLAAIFTALIKPSSEAIEMAQQMGIQFDAAAIKAAGGMQQFLESLSADVKRFSLSSGMLEQEIYGRLFGSAESLRAITPLVGNLADKFRSNATEMQNSAGTVSEAFDIMGNTGSAEIQLLNNKLGEYTDIIQSSIGNLSPYANFISQVIITGNSAYSLGKTISTLGVISKTTSSVVATFSPICKVVSAAFTGAAVSAETLKLAVRSLYITAGVGIAIFALTEAINLLSASSDKAANSVDNLSQAEEKAKQAHEQTAQQISSVRSEMSLNIAKLKDFKGSKEQEKTLVQQMNSKYGEAVGYYSTVSQWYQALTANSEAYCNQMINEIRLRELANQAADLIKQQHDIKYDENGKLRKYSTKNKTKTKTVGQMDAGDGKIIPIKQEVEVEGTSQVDEANRKMTLLFRQQQNVKKQMESIVRDGQKIKFKHTAGYSSAPPSLSTGNTTKGGAATSTKSDVEEKALKGSIDFYEEEIRELQKKINASADEAAAKSLRQILEGKQRELGMLKVRLGIESVPGIEIKKKAKDILSDIDEQIDRLRLNPIEIKVEGLGDLEKLQSLGNINLSSFQNVQQQLHSINGISDSTAKGLAVAGESCAALGSAMQQLGSDSAAAKAGMMMAAVGQIVLSFAQAMTSTKTWIDWLAFGITGAAQLTSIIGMISKFATGGIVGGNQKSGDNVLVRVNSGEMILNAAQQARLFAIANGASLYGAASQVGSGIPEGFAPGVKASTSRLQGILVENDQTPIDINLRLRGRDIVGAVANETRSNRKRSNIRIR